MENKPSLQQNCLCFFANKNFVFITKQGFEEPSVALQRKGKTSKACFLRAKLASGLSIKNKIFYFL